MQWATVEAVAGGTELIDECPACHLDRTRCDMLALMPVGVTRLGELTECGGCLPYFQCGDCGRFIGSDGPVIWAHVAEKHGRPVDV
jgi:hypothetical protein